MPFGEEPGNWTYGVCESCLKNAHEKIKMIREKIVSEDMWVCPSCGSCKKL